MNSVLRRALIVGVHLFLWSVAFAGAYALRFEGSVPPELVRTGLLGLAVLLTGLVVAFWVLGLFHGLMQYSGIPEATAIVQAVTLAVGGLVIAGVVLPQLQQPRSIYAGAWILCVALSGGLRFAVRLFREWAKRSPERGLKPAVLLGVGDAGDSLLRDLERRPAGQYRIVCALDDDAKKQGGAVRGIPVLGAIEDETLRSVVAKYELTTAVLAMPGVAGARVREILRLCRGLGLQTKTLPSVHQIVDGEVTVSMLRDVAIEDLLRREPVELDAPSMDALLRGRRVLITGAAGSIGSELARQALRYAPSELAALDHDENGLFFLDRELRASFPGQRLQVVLADIRDKGRLGAVLQAFRPDVVLHAAAHKHVPLMEANPTEAVVNNALGTRNVADLALAHGVSTFVLISTDKAVNPTSVMGATKRVAELYVQALSHLRRTRFVVVRFGNVLGSAGSVVQIFREQIARGGPVTITHPDMRRYFMTIPEACQLVLQAGAVGKSGEVSVLDMGEPVRIVDLAEDMIRMSGYEPGRDIEVQVTGIRPGEKLYEELLIDREHHAETSHPKILAGDVQAVSLETARGALERLAAAVPDGALAVRAVLAELVPEAHLGSGAPSPSTDEAPALTNHRPSGAPMTATA